jgi:hypothetical protein
MVNMRHISESRRYGDLLDKDGKEPLCQEEFVQFTIGARVTVHMVVHGPGLRSVLCRRSAVRSWSSPIG